MKSNLSREQELVTESGTMRQEIQPTPQYLKGRGAEFFHGVCRRDEDLIMVIDLERILTSGERMDLDQIARMQQEEGPGR